MKNIWHIFSGDMKRLVRNPFALIIAIGLCIIPSLYAWFNIYSNWDPYANTKNIKIAVATEDAGYQMDDAEYFEMATETSYYQIELEGNNSPDIDIKVTADGTILK